MVTTVVVAQRDGGHGLEQEGRAGRRSSPTSSQGGIITQHINNCIEWIITCKSNLPI